MWGGRPVGQMEVGSSLAGRSGLHRVAVISLLAIAVGVAVGVAYEVRTSHLQALVFTRIAAGFGYEVGEGPSERIRFPVGGPYDERLGYARIPSITQRLDSLGFALTHQARMSPALARWVDRGVHPVYPAKGPVGLRVYDRRGALLVADSFPRFGYREFDSIPEVVWRTLVHIESQGMLEAGGPRRNPAVEWDRLLVGAASLALREIDPDRSVPGGSTLATQIEKYRHSPGGVTRSPGDKVRQMMSASLRAYSGGPETVEWRRSIITDYLNSVPLSGQLGHGEVTGIGEGLWAWYGIPFERANASLSAEPELAFERLEKATIYRQVLSLLVAQRRPSYYLASPAGRRSLDQLTDAYLRLLEDDGVIPAWLAADARRVGPLRVQSRAPSTARWGVPSGTRGLGPVTASLLELTRARGVYELERYDLVAQTSVDAAWSTVADDLLRSMRDRDILGREGFTGQGLLGSGDPESVLYSVLLMERTPLGNAVRVQVDNYPGEMSLADASRLELGSTAKLRTLVTYLEVIEEIYGRLGPLDPDSLRTVSVRGRDELTRWVARTRLNEPAAPLERILDLSLAREYSASPQERFWTGGSEHTFGNFDSQFDRRTLTVREAFRYSVNLPFVRLMRDIVQYETGQLATADLLANGDSDVRREYLRRFAQHEGTQYVRRFHARYKARSGHEVFDQLLAGRRQSSIQRAWAIRSVAPDASLETFRDLMEVYGADSLPSEPRVAALYAAAEPSGLPLSDLGHLSRIHPLELWVASQRLHRPSAQLGDLLLDSRPVMIDVYGWLLRTARANAQDVRIRSVLEIEAFQRIHARWKRLGYPFDDLAPSLGSAIGSSGDRPLALAELVGLIQNRGVRLPVVRVESLYFAEETPFETRFALRAPLGEPVLSRQVASAVESALYDVVEAGTGRRARGSLTGPDGASLRIGGKTGTGDNRYRVFDARGRVLETRTVNRTATFVFLAGDRYFGVVTAYVSGAAADRHRFTSALPTQLLRVLGGRLGALEGEATPEVEGMDTALPPRMAAVDVPAAPPPISVPVIVPVIVPVVATPLVEDHVHERAGDQRLVGLGAQSVDVSEDLQPELVSHQRGREQCGDSGGCEPEPVSRTQEPPKHEALRDPV